MAAQKLKFLWCFLFLALALNTLTWFSARYEQSRWTNVPAAPSKAGAVAFALGDAQLSYRMMGIMIQNLGDIGGRTSSLKDYDYEALSGWFYLSKQLDPHSDFMPYLAAFYFGSAQDPSVLPPLIDYLYEVGNDPAGEKFRWLAQAVFLMRYKVGDLDKAYEMAQTLANLDRDLPIWARSMPALVKSQAGEKQVAVDLLIELLKSSGDKLHPNEVNATIAMICEQLLDESQASRHPLCQKSP